MAALEPETCPICAEPFKAGDTCASDIELGTCHAACLEGSAVVDLNTGEPSSGPIATYPYQPQAGEAVANRCSDCPPVGYPTDETRCLPCDRRASPQPAQAMTALSAQDPMIILAGIKQFGLASDGSDLRDLEATIQKITDQRDQKTGRATQATPKDVPCGCASSQDPVTQPANLAQVTDDDSDLAETVHGEIVRIRRPSKSIKEPIIAAYSAHVTDEMVDMAEMTLARVLIGQHYVMPVDGMKRVLTVAIGAGGQAVARPLSWIDVLREWFGGERYARDYEYLDANYSDHARRVATYAAAHPPHPADERVVEALVSNVIDKIAGEYLPGGLFDVKGLLRRVEREILDALTKEGR